jgi:HKD family nuclease
MTYGNMGWERNTGETMKGYEGTEEQRKKDMVPTSSNLTGTIMYHNE